MDLRLIATPCFRIRLRDLPHHIVAARPKKQGPPTPYTISYPHAYFTNAFSVLKTAKNIIIDNIDNNKISKFIHGLGKLLELWR
jgi:hypothetical protein